MTSITEVINHHVVHHVEDVAPAAIVQARRTL